MLAPIQMLYSLRAAIELLVKQKSMELRRNIVARKARELAETETLTAAAAGAQEPTSVIPESKKDQ